MTGRIYRHDKTMPSQDALSAAIEQLYGIDPADFTERRDALAGQARRAGDPAGARAIAGLRRPTKAAWIINTLVRAQPDVARGLGELGTQLRAAQRALDGAQLRQLTQQRRRLIDAATRQAFGNAALAQPSATLRQEVASTFEAALADPDVAALLEAATLVRSAHWSGFGEAGPPLAAVPEPKAARRPVEAPGRSTRAATPRGRAPTAPGATPGTGASPEQRRLARVAQAEAALAAADVAAAAAAEAEQELDRGVVLLSEQLADARRRLDEARLDTRRARARHREAQRELGRMRR